MIEKLKAILEENTGLKDIEIDANTDLKSDLGLNSFDLAELACQVEEKFNVSIPERAVKDIKTVGDVIAFIEKQ